MCTAYISINSKIYNILHKGTSHAFWCYLSVPQPKMKDIVYLTVNICIAYIHLFYIFIYFIKVYYTNMYSQYSNCHMHACDCSFT